MPYDKFKDGATAQPGLFTVWRKQGKVYFEIGSSQLDHSYLMASIAASGLGQVPFAGQVFGSRLIEFHRAGDRIITVEKNTFGKAQPGSAAAEAVSLSYPQSVLSADPVTAIDKATGNMVFPADLLLGDVVNLTDGLNRAAELARNPRVSYRLDPRLSYFGLTKAFPKNVDVEADLTWSSASPGPIDSVPDPRSLFLRLHHTIVELPDDGYRPRYADDRIGYFLTARRQYDDQTTPTSFARYITRWRMEKSDPNTRSSPAKNPIIYYLSNTIPVRYRKAVADGLMEWNKAFEAIGITHAIEVRPQPDDPSWDPDDARYSVVRWITTTSPPFGAYGPHFANPLTGEIFRVDIVIDGNIMRFRQRDFENTVRPTALDPQERAACSHDECDFGSFAFEQAQWGYLALSMDDVFAKGGITPDEYGDRYLKSVVLHEAGHNFGLRHNFQSSTIYTMKQLHDKKFTSTHGLVGSVMEYTPLNLSPHGQPQGDYFQTVLGPWDYFTIRYGYEPINAKSPEDEMPALQRLAAQATRPELAYSTDEDAAWSSGFATDPRVQTGDLSNDALAYAESLFVIDRRLFATLEARLPQRGHSFADARGAFMVLLSSWNHAADIASRYIGGEYFTRNHRGDPNAAAPFRPVPREQERQAFSLLARYALADDAFRFPPSLLNSLGDERYRHWESDPNSSGRLDFPLEELVQRAQASLLGQMWQPTVLSRLVSLETRVARPGETMSLSDLYNWTDEAVWGDLSSKNLRTVPTVHRALQHRYAEMLVHLTLKPDPGTPQDARALARHHLSWLSHQLGLTLRRGGLDQATQASFEDVKTTIDRALSADIAVPAS